MDLELVGRRVLVSGASRGIGLGIAQAFAREGARLALVARGMESLSAAAASLPTKDNVALISADMTAEDQIRTAVRDAETQLGALDVVVANVGSGSAVSGYDVPREEWERVMTLNFFGAASLASAVAPSLAAKGGGCIIFVSSIAGLESVQAPAPYAAAKAALRGLIRSYARSLGPRDVRVNAVAPGNIVFPGGGWELKRNEDRAAVETMLEREVALRRFGTPAEIGDAVAFLASPRAAFITGATIIVDGGQTRAI